MSGSAATRSLDEQLAEFQRRRFIAMPIAGAIAWAVIGIAGATLEPLAAVWTLYIATGSIFYLGLLVSRFTGEDLLGRGKKNRFDALFMATVAQAVLVFSIAIPFARADYTSLPMSVGILTGLMWVPLSWLLQHWIGAFHGIGRTVGVLTAWYLLPAQRFVAIPIVIIVMYAITIFALERRWKAVNAAR